ncbi:MAG: hypothetical protein ABIG30_03195 [Candidatus Aenigmatarchaeota archaeon]
MFFLRKHKQDKDIEDIKKTLNEPVEEPVVPQPSGMDFGMPEQPEQPEEEISEPLPNYEPPYEPRYIPPAVPAPRPVEPIFRKQSGEAPLFIKIDKYNELLGHLQELRSFMSATKETFQILEEIETARSDAVKILRTSIQRMERSLAIADNELGKPETPMSEEFSRGDVDNVETSLQSLKKEIGDLRKELGKFE